MWLLERAGLQPKAWCSVSLHKYQAQSVIYGAHSSKTTVGWRFKVQSRSQIVFSHWHSDYTSPYQTAQADSSTPASAGHGFSRLASAATFDTEPDITYRVVVEMQWWQNGSVEGYVKLRYNSYEALRDDGASHSSTDYCWARYRGFP